MVERTHAWHQPGRRSTRPWRAYRLVLTSRERGSWRDSRDGIDDLDTEWPELGWRGSVRWSRRCWPTWRWGQRSDRGTDSIPTGSPCGWRT